MRTLAVTWILMVLTVGPERLARADRSEAKTIIGSPMPYTTRNLRCVLKMHVNVTLPTSLGGGKLASRKATAFIDTTPGPMKDIDIQTLTVAIKPKSGTEEDKDYTRSVETGTVSTTERFRLGKTFDTREDVYANREGYGPRAISFRTDNSGHLALIGLDARIHLDFGTGLLQRTWQGTPFSPSVYVDTYACAAAADPK